MRLLKEVRHLKVLELHPNSKSAQSDFYYLRYCLWKISILCCASGNGKGTLLSITIIMEDHLEILQMVIPYRAFNINDLIFPSSSHQSIKTLPVFHSKSIPLSVTLYLPGKEKTNHSGLTLALQIREKQSIICNLLIPYSVYKQCLD